MDKISAYESSDSDDSTDFKIVNSDDKDIIPQLSPTLRANDFFSLDDSSGEDSSSHADYVKRRKIDDDQKSKVYVKPNSEFWSGNDQINYSWESHRVELENNKTVSSKQLVGMARVNDEPKLWGQLNKNTQNKNYETCFKGFYIHSKIQPFLSQCNHAKLPLKVKSIQKAHIGGINKIQWNNSQYSHLILTAGMDRKINVISPFASNRESLRTISVHRKAVKSANWFYQGRQILSASYDKTCMQIDVEKGTELGKFEHESFVSCLNIHPDNVNCFVTGSCDVLYAWDVREKTSKPVRKFTYKDKFGQAQDVIFINDGKEMVICNDFASRESADRNIMVWDFRAGVVLSNQIYQERFTCTHLLPHPFEKTFVAQSLGNYIPIFSTVKPYHMNKCKRFDKHKVNSYSIGMSFSRDGKYLYTGSSDGKLFMYDYFSSKCLKTLAIEKNDTVMDVDSHPVLPSTVACCTWNGYLAVCE